MGRRPSVRFFRRGAGRGGAIGGPSEKKGKTNGGREVQQEGNQCCPLYTRCTIRASTLGPPSSARGKPNSQWNWVPGHYVPPPGSQVPPPWIAGPPTWEQASWQPVALVVRPFDSTSRRKKQTAYELGSQERGTATRKPSLVVVQEGGEIDASSDGKNAWDEAIRNFVPKILDMSIVEWGKHPPNTTTKLREALDDKFEYVGHSLSMSGFRTTVTRYMKSKRSCLKTRWLSGKEKALSI